MFYALKGDGQSDKELNDYAELIKRAVSDIDGVARVEIYGKRSQCVNIELREEKMANLGVMPVEVIRSDIKDRRYLGMEIVHSLKLE